MRRIVLFYVAASSFALLLPRCASSQAGQVTTPDLDARRDSSGQIMVKDSTAEPPRSATEEHGSIDILNDTHGVDLGPYLTRIFQAVRENWYSLIPVSAQMRKGKLAIEFAIAKDGAVVGMKLVATSRDVALDRAAWAGIIASSPFPPLPTEFKGNHLALRFRFFYNPEPADLGDAKSSAPVPELVHAMRMAHYADANLPRYPKKARQAKMEGFVQLEAEVGTDGKIRNLKVLEGVPMLADASVRAIRKWRFYPAQKDGKPVADQARISVEFRLDRERVAAEVVPNHDASPSPAR